jgi:pyroglutamyl-peptidase
MIRSCHPQMGSYIKMFALIQGFGPFGGFDPNPSELLVRALAERRDSDIRTEVLPVSLDRVRTEVPKLIEETRPRVWLGVGLAAGRTALALEAVAVNLADWAESAADADGVSVTRVPIASGGPAAHLTTLPAEAILTAWREAGIPGYLSQTAGSYLCNFSFYTAAEAARQLGLSCMVGFLHVPLLPELVSQPQQQASMSMALQSAGLDLVMQACRTADAGGIYLGSTDEA